MSSPLILLSSIFMSFLMISMQYSGAQNIAPISNEGILTPDEEPDVQGSGPQIPEPELQEEPEAQVEEPEAQKEDPPVVGEGEPQVQGEDESLEQPTPTDPGKGPIGGLDITNTTQQALPPAFKIKIIFEAIMAFPANYDSQTDKEFCEDWDMGVYVQGKLVRLNDINQPLKICGSKTVQLKNAEITVEIPGQSVESPKDYQPLSIFTTGSELTNCNPQPLPTDLPEVRKILADKGPTRLGEAKEEIVKIQNQIGNGCIEKYWRDLFNCINFGGNRICASGYYNKTLANLDYVFGSPGYGKFVLEDTLGNPETVQMDTCKTPPPVDNKPSQFCLFYTMECPLCPAVRVH